MGRKSKEHIIIKTRTILHFILINADDYKLNLMYLYHTMLTSTMCCERVIIGHLRRRLTRTNNLCHVKK